jgi:hypothetical protein
MRYSAESLQRELGDRFELLESSIQLHRTPFGTTSNSYAAARESNTHSRLRIRNLLGYTSRMGSRASRIIAAVILVTCLACPLAELFDYWDQTIQTGNDTEYALVVLALCVGAGYSFARLIFKSALLSFVAKSVFAPCAQRSLFSAACGCPSLFFDATSPPSLPLRI